MSDTGRWIDFDTTPGPLVWQACPAKAPRRQRFNDAVKRLREDFSCGETARPTASPSRSSCSPSASAWPPSSPSNSGSPSAASNPTDPEALTTARIIRTPLHDLEPRPASTSAPPAPGKPLPNGWPSCAPYCQTRRPRRSHPPPPTTPLRSRAPAARQPRPPRNPRPPAFHSLETIRFVRPL